MDTIKRTSTFIVLWSPTSSNSFCCSTLKSFTWRSSEKASISSSSTVPPLAISKRPLRSFMAPVKAPLVWPNSSLSIISLGRAPHDISIKGLSLLFLSALWMARAIILLPVPLSPRSKMVAFVLETLSIIEYISFMEGSWPTRSWKVSGFGCRNLSIKEVLGFLEGTLSNAFSIEAMIFLSSTGLTRQSDTRSFISSLISARDDNKTISEGEALDLIDLIDSASLVVLRSASITLNTFSSSEEMASSGVLATSASYPWLQINSYNDFLASLSPLTMRTRCLSINFHHSSDLVLYFCRVIV